MRQLSLDKILAFTWLSSSHGSYMALFRAYSSHNPLMAPFPLPNYRHKLAVTLSLHDLSLPTTPIVCLCMNLAHFNTAYNEDSKILLSVTTYYLHGVLNKEAST
jgi:hypothetical protein